VSLNNFLFREDPVFFTFLDHLKLFNVLHFTASICKSALAVEAFLQGSGSWGYRAGKLSRFRPMKTLIKNLNSLSECGALDHDYLLYTNPSILIRTPRSMRSERKYCIWRVCTASILMLVRSRAMCYFRFLTSEWGYLYVEHPRRKWKTCALLVSAHVCEGIPPIKELPLHKTDSLVAHLSTAGFYHDHGLIMAVR